MRQQPSAARSCGFGERDRRVIDPPPIVQLTITDPTCTPDQLRQQYIDQRGTMIIHCSIWDETGTRDMSLMPEDFRAQRRMMGTLVSNAFSGLDENGDFGCFFPFPDLSVRTPGTFTLQFTFVNLLKYIMDRGKKIQISDTIISAPFQVYNAKDFPGMRASTALTRALKAQGCQVSIKKGNEKGGQREREDGSVEEDDSGKEDGQGKSKGRKKAKRNP